MSVSRRIAVVGGGISGIAAAYQLAAATGQHSFEFTLFEASGRLGGIVETRRSHGFVIECGPDSWVTDKPWARELALELGLEDQIISSNDHQRRTYLLQDDHLIPMPDGMRMMVPTNLDALSGSPLFSPQALAAYRDEPRRAEELKSAAAARTDDESVADFVRRHFGDEVATTLAAPLLAGVFGGSIDSLSVRAVMPALVKMEREHGSLILALQHQARSSVKPVFTTLSSGLGTLIDRMSEKIPGNSVRLHTAVLGLSRNGSRWNLATSAGEETFDSVVLATPAHVTRGLLSPLDARFDSLLAIDATSAIVIAFAFAPENAAALHVPEGFGYLVPQRSNLAEDSLLACTFVDQKFPHRAPEGGKLLRAFFGGKHAPALMAHSDESLAELAKSQLERVLGPLPQPVEVIVRRWPQSLPQYAVGYPERIREFESLLAGFPSLLAIGNAYHGVGLPDLIRDGRAAARKLLQG